MSTILYLGIWFLISGLGCLVLYLMQTPSFLPYGLMIGFGLFAVELIKELIDY